MSTQTEATNETTPTYWIPSEVYEAGMQPDGYKMPIPYTRHAMSALASPLTGQELAYLEESIIENGLYQPIKVYQDQVVQGWHRLNVLCKHGLLDTKKHVRVHKGAWDRLFDESVALEMAHRHMTVTQQAKYYLDASALRGVDPKHLPGYDSKKLGPHLKSLRRASRKGLMKFISANIITSSEVNRICQAGLADLIADGTIDPKAGKGLASRFAIDKEARDDFLNQLAQTEDKDAEALANTILDKYQALREQAVADAKAKEAAEAEAQETEEPVEEPEEVEAQEEPEETDDLNETEQAETELLLARQYLEDHHSKVKAQEERIAHLEGRLAEERERLTEYMKEGEALGRREEAALERIDTLRALEA